MVTLRNFLNISFGLFLLTRCNIKDNNPTVTPSFPAERVDNSLVGEWKYNNTIWYSSELTLCNDGTFIYHDQSCNGQRFSQGQWTNANGSTSLISFDAFKQKKQIEAINTYETTERHKSKRKLKNGEVEYSFVGFKETIVLGLPSATDTIRVYLDNVQLKLRNDTLYCISLEKLPEEAKFHRTKNNH